MNIETLLMLAENPHYKLSPQQLKQLEEYRNSKFVKHQTTFKKHPVDIPEEEPKDD